MRVCVHDSAVFPSAIFIYQNLSLLRLQPFFPVRFSLSFPFIVVCVYGIAHHDPFLLQPKHEIDVNWVHSP